MRILMVEDNTSVSEMMSMFFKKEGWEATYVTDGNDAVLTFNAAPQSWDLILLDLNLPGLDGMQVAMKIREVSKLVLIMMLTARDTESDQVLGLEMGADDYVTKPFSPITLIARMRAIYRRAKIANGTIGPVDVHEEFDVVTSTMKLNSSTREAYLNGQLIQDLTPKEFDLLRALAGKQRQVFSREQLLQLVWDYEYFGDERTVDAHVKKLRQKIEKVGPQVIQTVWGVGYKFDDSSVNGAD
ncbi:response regulator transcription factor [Weissella soli]|uniref:response regulator transcription factor n=1 Tax=Weissella soli TaxID=155866 RepID=UPI001F385CFB|nr:response regulator transcription factor [Weissella soli]GJM48281.1 DNA-binding response regulator [Weissella soli]